MGDMNVYITLGIVGIICNLAASLADIPLAKPGKPDSSGKLSMNGVAQWWADVSSKRFKVSFWLSFLGQPGAYVTMWFLADLISKENEALALALQINTLIGCYTGLLCHVVFLVKPLLYQKLSKKMSDDECADVINAVNPVMNAPMVIASLSLWLVGPVIIAIAIITGALAVSKWCLLLSPIVSAIVLVSLKKCKIKIPGALGVGYMLISILLIIAGM